MSVAGLLTQSKYGQTVLRAGDVKTDAPFTILNSEMHDTIIQLPLPLNLASSMSANWQQEEISLPGYILKHNKKRVQELLHSYKDGIATHVDGIVASIIDGANEDIQRMWARSTQSSSTLGGLHLAKNPRIEMLFNSMNFRTYSFTFMLVPHTKKDSDDIEEAIKKIQIASAPALLAEKIYMEYPQTWWIKFMSGSKGSGDKYLMKINECCCTNVNVNYTPQGDSRNLHDDNAPLAVELTLDFTEVIIPSKETLEKYSG